MLDRFDETANKDKQRKITLSIVEGLKLSRFFGELPEQQLAPELKIKGVNNAHELLDRVSKSIGKSNEDIDKNNLNIEKEKKKYIDYISQNKEYFSPRMVEWLKQQQIEVIRYIYTKLSTDNGLKIFKQSKEQCFQREKLNREEIICSLVGVLPNSPLNECTNKQAEKILELERIDDETLEDFFEVKFKSQFGKLKGVFDEDTNALDDKDEIKDDYSEYYGIKEFILSKDDNGFSDVYQDIFEEIIYNTDICNYFQENQLKTIKKQCKDSSFEDLNILRETLAFTLNDYLDDIDQLVLSEDIKIDKILKDFGMDNEYINIFKDEFINQDDVLNIESSIIIANLYDTYKAYLQELTKRNVIKKYFGSSIVQDKYVRSRFNKLSFSLSQLKFLINNNQNLGKQFMFEIFNQTSAKEIKGTIDLMNNMSKNYNLEGTLNFNKKTDDFCYKFLLNEQQRELLKEKQVPKGQYLRYAPEAIDTLEEFLKKLK